MMQRKNDQTMSKKAWALLALIQVRPTLSRRAGLSVSPKLSGDTSACEVKRRWREKQINAQQRLAVSINATWSKDLIQLVWCGWLRKTTSGFAGQWRQQPERWFELRRENSCRGSFTSHNAVLQYHGRAKDGTQVLKHISVVEARRESRQDKDGCACVSVRIAERRGRLYLHAATSFAAENLLIHITSILQPTRCPDTNSEPSPPC